MSYPFELRVHDKAGSCEGLLVSFGFEKTHQRSKLWNVKEIWAMNCVKVFRRFSGGAALATELLKTTGDLYEIVWNVASTE